MDTGVLMAYRGYVGMWRMDDELRVKVIATEIQ